MIPTLTVGTGRVRMKENPLLTSTMDSCLRPAFSGTGRNDRLIYKKPISNENDGSTLMAWQAHAFGVAGLTFTVSMIPTLAVGTGRVNSRKPVAKKKMDPVASARVPGGA